MMATQTITETPYTRPGPSSDCMSKGPPPPVLSAQVSPGTHGRRHRWTRPGRARAGGRRWRSADERPPPRRDPLAGSRRLYRLCALSAGLRPGGARDRAGPGLSEGRRMRRNSEQPPPPSRIVAARRFPGRGRLYRVPPSGRANGFRMRRNTALNWRYPCHMSHSTLITA